MSNHTTAKTTDPPPDCLTPGDRALLNAVFGWHMPSAPYIAPSLDAHGKPVLIPLMAWVIADARRHGEVDGDITPGQFADAAAAVNRSPTAALHLSPAQIARGLRHLESLNPLRHMPMGALSAGRATAAAG